MVVFVLFIATLFSVFSLLPLLYFPFIQFMPFNFPSLFLWVLLILMFFELYWIYKKFNPLESAICSLRFSIFGFFISMSNPLSFIPLICFLGSFLLNVYVAFLIENEKTKI